MLGRVVFIRDHDYVVVPYNGTLIPVYMMALDIVGHFLALAFSLHKQADKKPPFVPNLGRILRDLAGWY
jgi:hypothetical protein